VAPAYAQPVTRTPEIRNLKKERCEQWAATRESAEGCDDFKVHLVEVDFDTLADAAQGQAMKHLPTSFHLSVEDVDGLRVAAREIMTSSTDFQEFMRETGGRWSAAAE